MTEVGFGSTQNKQMVSGQRRIRVELKIHTFDRVAHEPLTQRLQQLLRASRIDAEDFTLELIDRRCLIYVTKRVYVGIRSPKAETKCCSVWWPGMRTGSDTKLYAIKQSVRLSDGLTWRDLIAAHPKSKLLTLIDVQKPGVVTNIHIQETTEQFL